MVMCKKLIKKFSIVPRLRILDCNASSSEILKAGYILRNTNSSQNCEIMFNYARNKRLDNQGELYHNIDHFHYFI